MAYNIEGMKAAIHEKTCNAKKPFLDSNPKLNEFLVHGTLKELIVALVNNSIPDPWWTVAACQIPFAPVLMVISPRVG